MQSEEELRYEAKEFHKEIIDFINSKGKKTSIVAKAVLGVVAAVFRAGAYSPKEFEEQMDGLCEYYKGRYLRDKHAKP